MTGAVLEIPAPQDPTGPIVPDTPTQPAVPEPGPAVPDLPDGPSAPEPDDPLPPDPTGRRCRRRTRAVHRPGPPVVSA